jgi:gamma-glutamylcyclotransferase (GGCT)/AIG2-like uncharacterized protein YtfP
VLNLLFVYGTLRRAFDNDYARLLRASADFEREAAVRGRLHSLGIYTAFVPDGDGQVPGELYRLREPERTLVALDDYEGEEYERIVVDVEGSPAWIYRLRA